MVGTIEKIAPRFGISDVALGKICRRAGIPVPFRGYWAKREANPRVEPLPLPPRPPGVDDTVTFGAGRPYWQQCLTDAEILGPIPPPPTFSEDLETVRQRVKAQIGRVSCPKTLTDPHIAIERLLQADEERREKQREDRYISSWNALLFDSPIDQRRLRILNALFIAVARVGCKPVVTDKEAQQLQLYVGDVVPLHAKEAVITSEGAFA